MKRLISFALTLALTLSLIPAAYAASDEATEAAQALYELGLFNGVGTNADSTPNFDLDRAPTRQEAITMLVRLLGKEEEAKSSPWETPFTDVDEWAKPYVGYAYAYGLTTGTGETTFGGGSIVTASQYLTFVLRALGYESGTDFQWDSAWTKSDEIKLTDGRYNAETKVFTRGDVAIISNNALSATLKGQNTRLSEFLGFTQKKLTAEDLQGIWNRREKSADGGEHISEIIFEGNTATYMMYNGLETVYTTGIFTLADDGSLSWVTSDYYLYAPVTFGENVIHHQNEEIFFPSIAVRLLANTTTKLCDNYKKIQESVLYERCHRIVDSYNSGLTSDEKEMIRQEISEALENYVVAGESMKTALYYDGLLLLGSLGGMSYSQRLEAQNGMQKAELLAQTSCFLVETNLVTVREILEKKTGTEDLVKTLKNVEILFDNICNMTASYDHDELVAMSDAVINAGEALRDLADIIADRYFEN